MAAFAVVCSVTSVFAQAESALDDAAQASASPASPSAGALGAEDAGAALPDGARVSRHTLKNELQIVLQSIPHAPTVSVCTAFDAGSRRDPVGAPGAHRVLAEILRWGGYRSEEQDYEALVARRGGVSDVEVRRDTTIYCTTVPAAELPLALWVTAGRFTAGALTEDQLREAVEKLALLSEQDDSEVMGGRAPHRLRKMAFLGSYEYAHPTLPNPDDLDLLNIDQLIEIHEREYVAKRAVIAVIGGVDEEFALDQFPRQLYAARPGKPAPRFEAALIPQSTPRFSMAEDRTAKTPAAWYGWVAPPDEDRWALNGTLSLLMSKTRFEKTLLGPYGAAKSLELHLDIPDDTHQATFSRLEVVGKNSSALGAIEKQLDTQLRQLWTVGPTAEELAFAEQRLQELIKTRLETAPDRARALAAGVLYGSSPEQILAPLSAVAEGFRLTSDRIKHAAFALLAEHRRVTVEVYPKGWQDPWQSPMPRFHIVEKGQSLGSIARAYGTTVAVISKMNGIDRAKPIYPGDKLKVPRGKEVKERKLRTHEVRRGDTLSALALKYGVSVRDIASANGMGSKLNIRSGETLRIPWGQAKGKGSSGQSSSASGSSTSTSMRTHKVSAGQTLSGIAHQYGVSSVALGQANGISHKAMVRIGQILKVPPTGTGKSASAQEEKPVTHLVRPGDTLSGIASRYGVSVAALTVANKISRKSTLRPGQRLTIPAKK